MKTCHGSYVQWTLGKVSLVVEESGTEHSKGACNTSGVLNPKP